MLDRKQEEPETDHVDFEMHRIGAQYTTSQHWSQTARTAERKDTMHGYANKEQRTTE